MHAWVWVDSIVSLVRRVRRREILTVKTLLGRTGTSRPSFPFIDSLLSNMTVLDAF